jgi:adenylosuccinate lyase
MALLTGAFARIGDEVYELQRPELGELGEPIAAAAVGSITMPHKRNPEFCEHLSTLARLVRAASGVLLEGLASSHERDGRAWKAEWAALPDVALFSSRSAELAAQLLEGLRVDPVAMARNLGPGAGSEAVLVQLSRRIGKHRAQALLQEVLRGRGPAGAVHEIAAAAGVPGDEVASWLDGKPLGSATAMVDHVLARRPARGDLA